MKLEQLATTGSISITHDHARSLNDSDAYMIEIRDAEGELLVGTFVHNDEMDAQVGKVMADTLRRRVSGGAYIHTLTPLEIMGLRGSLVDCIAELPDADADDGEKFIVMCAVSGGVTGSREKPMRSGDQIQVFHSHGDADAAAAAARASVANHRGTAQFSYWVVPASPEILAQVASDREKARGPRPR
jgi:hypothetical protein